MTFVLIKTERNQEIGHQVTTRRIAQSTQEAPVLTLALAFSESVNGLVSVGRLQFPMQRVDLVSLRGHLLRDSIRSLASLFRFPRHAKLLIRQRRNDPSVPRPCSSRTCTHCTEDDALTNGQQVVKLYKHIVLVLLGVAIHVELSNQIHRQLFLLQSDFVGGGCYASRKFSDHIRKGRAEKNQLTGLWHSASSHE